ncbi:hypothetical protein PAXINDRAFT_182178, partial [Paxillus involutus ATCC 200175]
MQRTYGRRARRRSTVQAQTSDHSRAPSPAPQSDGSDDHSHTPSRPRKRQKVFVEIVSPSRATPKAPEPTQPKNRSPQSSSSASHTPQPQSHILRQAEVHPEPASNSMLGSPQTPTKTPRDLSSLFATPSHSRSPGRLARSSIVKRMLSRSRTELTIEASSTETPLALSETTAMSRQGSSHSLPTTFRQRDPTPEASTQSPSKVLPARNIRTYAGSSRSFLVALPIPGADPLDDLQDDTDMHESYTDLRTRWGVDNSEDDPRPYQDDPATASHLGRNASTSNLTQPSLPAGMINDLKSITELRSKGESRRFLDEVGYLFEGLDGSSAIGLRRASALELVSKLCDPDFNRRAKASDFYLRTWDEFLTARAGASDKIFDATVAFFAALAARDPHTLMDVAQQNEFISALVEILGSLDHKKDVLALVLASGRDADLKSHGILRTEMLPLKSLAEVVSKESHLSSTNQPSARFFISHTLAALPPSILRVQYLSALLTSLRTELGLLEPRITAYESGLQFLPLPSRTNTDVPSLYHIEACIRLLDSYLLGQWSSANTNAEQTSSIALAHSAGFTSELLSLCVVSSVLMRETVNEKEVTIARKCLCGALRVLTLLSHGDKSWCMASLDKKHTIPFVATIVMQSQAKWSECRAVDGVSDSLSLINSVEAFDLLCLALGLLMNWATLSRKAAALCRNKSINPSCPGARPCVRACQCPGQQSVLECLSTVYTQYLDVHEKDPPESSFLRGYLAVLLGLLIKDDTANQTLVLAKLLGRSPSDKIGLLVAQCRSFLDLYNGTAASLSADSPRASPEFTDEATDQSRTPWDKRGEEIACSVITSLEMLCGS